MSSAALQPPSYDDLLTELRALPQGTTGEILGEGWLRLMSRPGRKHRSVARQLLFTLRDRGVFGGDWVIEVEADIDLLGRLLVPDLAGWRLDPVSCVPVCAELRPKTSEPIQSNLPHVWGRCPKGAEGDRHTPTTAPGLDLGALRGKTHSGGLLDDTPITHTPDWAVEILSRSTQQGDRATKLPLYAQAGVGHVWVISPEAQTVEVYDNTGGKPLLVASARGEQCAILPPFEAPWDLAQFWRL